MRNIVIDLGNLEYLYSDTINAFIASNRHMLEVSGRIAILTEHPKVQDILKRAGLDNIMRIYRSEAEMIADAKEILRQTSSYRIDELQKAASSSATIQLPPQVVTPPSIPKGEFDEFRFEMGQQLADKLDNNQVPQYQHGIPGQSVQPPPQPPAAPSGYVAPQAPQGLAYEAPAMPNQAAPHQAPPHQGSPYGQPQTPQAGQGGYGAYLQGGPGAPAGFGDKHSDSAPAHFDYPTVQLPVTNYSQGANTPPQQPQNQDFNEGDSEDPNQRGRKGAEDRMRSPTARKAGGRRVGGREVSGAGEPGPEEAFSAYGAPSTPAPSHTPKVDPGAGYTGYGKPPQEPESQPSYGPISSPSSLIEEKSGSGKAILAIVVIALIGLIAFFFLRGEDEKPVEPPPVAAEPVVPPTPAPVDSAAIATPAPVDSVVAPPVAAEPPAVKPPEPPKPEPKPPAVAKERPVKKPKPSKPATAPVASEPEPEPEPEPKPSSQQGLADGQVRVTSEPSGAEVLVNFSKKGVTPLTITLGNNTNRIIVRKEGFKRYETTLSKSTVEKELAIDLTPDEDAAPTPSKAVVEEEPPAPPTPPPPAVVRPEPKPEPKPEVKAAVTPKRPEPEMPKVEPKPEPKPEPVAEVYGGPGVIFMSSSPARADIIIDGKDTGKKTPAKIELPAGRHKVEMVKSGQRASVEHVINEGKNKALHLNLQ